MDAAALLAEIEALENEDNTGILVYSRPFYLCVAQKSVESCAIAVVRTRLLPNKMAFD